MYISLGLVSIDSSEGGRWGVIRGAAAAWVCFEGTAEWSLDSLFENEGTMTRGDDAERK